ncbi:MAG: HAMP domain-containing sensor histidine kinase [Candidatus Gracilibacteria bacterium]|nr:HAMP domain-containing sensor histidine kinase [Candidatus Gracilibacteria bacterium]
MVQGFYSFSVYYTHNLKLENSLKLRIKGVENILINKQEYLKKISSNDFAIKSILEKGLSGVTIIRNNVRILGDINQEYFDKTNSFYNSFDYKYYTQIINLDTTYQIIVSEYNEYSYYSLFKNLIYFVLFSLPFLVVFYFLGFIFVGKNFKPIKEIIASLEDFSANINHELKTPITEIISTLSLTKEINKNHEKAIDTSLNSAQKLAKILDSMLGIINLVDSSYKKEKLDLISEINRIIKENDNKIAEKNIKLKKDFKNKNYIQNINKEHFEICVGNILKNAIKYSGDNAGIEIFFNNGILEIKDDGIGIEEKNLKNIFNRYFRENYLKEEGYGLGLSLVKKIIDLNGWKISIESEKNIGTTIIINFNK